MIDFFAFIFYIYNLLFDLLELMLFKLDFFLKHELIPIVNLKD